MELYGVRRKKRYVMPTAGIFMSIMSVGIYWSFCDAFAYPKSYRNIYLAIVVFSLVFTITGVCGNILRNILYVGYAAAFGIYAVLKTDYLQQHINVLYSYVMIKRQEYIQAQGFSDISSGIQFESSGEAAVIAIMGILLLIVAVCIFDLKSRTWSYFPAAGVIILGMVYGRTPSVRSCVLIITGAVGIAFSITNRRMEWKNKAIGYAVMFIIMVLCMPMANFTAQKTKEKVFSKNHDVAKIQQGYEETAKNIVLNIVEEIQNVSSFGRMTNISPVYTGKNIFSVTLDKRPRANIYFKEFSADTYQNNRWTSKADDSEFYSYRLKKIFSYGYKSVSSISDSLDNLIHMDMQIKYDSETKGGTKKLSLPYFSDLAHINTNKSFGSGNNMTLDNAIRLNDAERSVSRKADMYYIKYYDVPFQEYNELLNRNTSIIKDAEYAKYVEDNYLTVPEDEELRKFAEKIEFKEQTGLQCNSIKEALQADTEYTLNPGTLPFGKDYLDYFLFENKRGYCEHFATASTLLLRLKNIPSRYAAGYMITPGQFKLVTEKNAAGKVVKRYYVAQVQDHDAHAWSEVYKNGVGWIPVDMTKASSRSENQASVEEEQKTKPEPTLNADPAEDKKKSEIKNKNTKIPQSDNKKSNTPKDKKGQGNRKNKSDDNTNEDYNDQNSIKNKSDELAENKDELSAKDKIPFYAKVILVVFLVILAFIVYVLFASQKLFYLSYKKKIQKADDNSEILFVARRYMMKYMGRYGRKLEKLSDDEYINELSEICDIGSLGEILQKAAFSKNDISDEELCYCLDIMNKIALKIRDEKTLHCLNFELNLLQNFIIEKAK